METRKYEITATKEQLNVLEALFKTMESMGDAGSTRKILLYVDGDGAFRPKITREGESIPATIYDEDMGDGYIDYDFTLYSLTQPDVTVSDPKYIIFYDFG